MYKIQLYEKLVYYYYFQSRACKISKYKLKQQYQYPLY